MSWELDQRLAMLWGSEPATPEPPSLSHDQLGTIATVLALTFPVWVRRRKTSFAFVDATTFRQCHSIDFRFPPPGIFPADAQPRRGQRIYVPVWIGKKSALTKFNLVDETGNALVLLNSVESARLAANGLNAMVEGLNALADAKSQARGEAPPERSSQLETLYGITSGSVTTGPKLAKTALQDGELGDTLGEGSPYRAFLEDLAKGYMMLVPLVYEPDGDRLLKFEHHSEDSWNVNGGIRAGLLSSFALRDRVHGARRLPIGWAQSTHFAFEAPEDVRLCSAELSGRQWVSGDEEHAGHMGKMEELCSVQGRDAVDLAVGPRMAYDPSVADTDKDFSPARLLAVRQDQASLTFRLRPATASVMVPLAVTAFATAGSLWFARARLGELDGQTSAGLLLLFPATAAVLLARFGEHSFVTRLLRGTRMLMSVVAVCAIVAVAILAGGLVRGDVRGPVGTTTDCVPTKTTRVAPGQPIQTASGLRCSTPPALGPAEVDAGARWVVTGLAVVATLATIVLWAGLISTQWRVARSQRSGVASTPE